MTDTAAMIRRIYVASSWRNDLQPTVVRMLRAAGHEVYDFKNPVEGSHGFKWSEVGLPNTTGDQALDVCSATDYVRGIAHPIAVEGYLNDFTAMEWADTFVLVLPCGRSAHLELGWAAGAGRRTAVLLDDPVIPELMYRMVDKIAVDAHDLLDWLGGVTS